MWRGMRWTPPPRHQADARFGESEASVIGGDDDIAGERDFASAA